MPTASAITLTDLNTLDHVFTPRNISGTKALFTNGASNTIGGEEQLILSLDRANVNRTTTKVNVRLNVPIEHQVDGVYVVDDIARLNADIIVPSSLTDAQRDVLASLIEKAFSNATVKGYIEDGEPVY